MSYDVIVVGGGPSGLMACIAASKHGARVLLADKGDKLGRKLGISGGGRCNVTNVKEIDEQAYSRQRPVSVQRPVELRQQGNHRFL